MQAEDVNKIIDNLASKFGTTAKMLIPEIARYHIVKHSVVTVIFLILFLISAYIIYNTVKNYLKWQNLPEDHDIWSDDDIIGYIMFGSTVLGIISFIVFIINFFLPLANHAKIAVIYNAVYNFKFIINGGHQFLNIHLN